MCIPRSIENDIAATMVSFGFNSALSFTIEMLDRVRQAAQSARKIGVVEVLGEQAGWLALQAGIAVCADVVLIPEIPCDLQDGGSEVEGKDDHPGGLTGWWWWPKGAKFVEDTPAQAEKKPSTHSKLRCRRWQRARPVTTSFSDRVRPPRPWRPGLQLLIAEETYPLVLGPWARGGAPTAVDRQLGMAYGAGAVRALKAGKTGVMVAFVPPDIKFVPLAEAINKVRTVPADSEFVKIAQSLGIFLGREL